MIKKLLGAAAIAAVAFTVVPASAASSARMGGCSGSNLQKTESSVEAMADSEGKMMAFKEMTAAQTAMLDGKMGACAMHLNHAMNDTTMRPSYAAQ